MLLELPAIANDPLPRFLIPLEVSNSVPPNDFSQRIAPLDAFILMIQISPPPFGLEISSPRLLDSPVSR